MQEMSVRFTTVEGLTTVKSLHGMNYAETKVANNVCCTWSNTEDRGFLERHLMNASTHLSPGSVWNKLELSNRIFKTVSNPQELDNHAELRDRYVNSCQKATMSQTKMLCYHRTGPASLEITTNRSGEELESELFCDRSFHPSDARLRVLGEKVSVVVITSKGDSLVKTKNKRLSNSIKIISAAESASKGENVCIGKGGKVKLFSDHCERPRSRSEIVLYLCSQEII